MFQDLSGHFFLKDTTPIRGSHSAVMGHPQGALLGRDGAEDPAEHPEEGGPVPSLGMEACLTGRDTLHQRFKDSTFIRFSFPHPSTPPRVPG